MKPLVSMVPQRHRADCTAAVMSMFLGMSYEEVLLALARESPGLLKKGAWFTELVRASKHLGVPFKIKRRWSTDFDDGIVHVKFHNRTNHVVLLRAGLYFDTNFEIWHPADYLKARRAKTGSLLVREDQ